jgi:hypothetical protein
VSLVDRESPKVADPPAPFMPGHERRWPVPFAMVTSWLCPATTTRRMAGAPHRAIAGLHVASVLLGVIAWFWLDNLRGHFRSGDYSGIISDVIPAIAIDIGNAVALGPRSFLKLGLAIIIAESTLLALATFSHATRRKKRILARFVSACDASHLATVSPLGAGIPDRRHSNRIDRHVRGALAGQGRRPI